jgi:alanyl-tRNA synthetase
MQRVQVLGDHVDQKGSIVQPERLRFDFSHGGPIDGPTLGRIENICGEQLARDLPIYAREVALADARQINGALLMVFARSCPGWKHSASFCQNSRRAPARTPD